MAQMMSSTLFLWLGSIFTGVVILVIGDGVIRPNGFVRGAVRWVKATTIDRFKAYVEAPHRDVERLDAEVKVLRSQRVEDVFVASQFIKRLEAQDAATKSLGDALTELSSRVTTITEPVMDAATRFPNFEHRLTALQQDAGAIRDWVATLHMTPDDNTRSSVKSMSDVMARLDMLEELLALLQAQLNASQARASLTPGVERIEQHVALQHDLGKDGSRSEAPRGQ
jgi:hypothetical protein